MRRDVFIANDSGGFSVVAADAVDAIIEDGRSDDERFVADHKALLLELYGDDAMPVRIVVDEPLRDDEAAQWLARASWYLNTPDGRLLVMGGFDPDVMSWWKDETGTSADGKGVALVQGIPGLVRVDVYAHAGSMNGRQILSEAGDKPGAAFRRDHPDRAWPLWLAKMLEFSGEDDPGYEALWRDVPASVKSGALRLDVEGPAPIGFLVHVTRAASAAGSPPAGGWFERDVDARVPATFPVGLPSDVGDPEIDWFRDKLLGRTRTPEPAPVATAVTEIIEAWDGAPLKAVQPAPPLELSPAEAFFLYWMAGFTADSPPRYELWVTAKQPWPRPEPTPEFAVVTKNASVTALGPPADAAGWLLWWSARMAAATLTAIPDGSTIDLAMAARLDYDAEADPAVGRALYSGTVIGGRWRLEDASPAIDRATLENVTEGAVPVRGDAEREAFDRAVESYVFEEESVQWSGDTARLSEPDERTLLLLAGPVFRVRFGAQWPCDPVEEE
jgi:hypothetical protein